MKKLYHGKGKRVHPTPPAPAPWDHLAAIPAALLALSAALTAEDQEVLAYLLSGGGVGGSGEREGEREKKRGKRKQQRLQKEQVHPPHLGCGCFGCYKSFWARWDASPNSHVIHRIIDAYEETLHLESERAHRGRSSRRRRTGRKNHAEDDVAVKEEMMGGGAVADEGHVADDDGDDDEEDEYDDEGNGDGVGGCKSLGRRFMSFIGERVWGGVWN